MNETKTIIKNVISVFFIIIYGVLLFYYLYALTLPFDNLISEFAAKSEATFLIISIIALLPVMREKAIKKDKELSTKFYEVLRYFLCGLPTLTLVLFFIFNI